MSNSSKIKRVNAEKFSERLQFHTELILWHMCHVLKSYCYRRLEVYKSTLAYEILLLSPFPTRDIWCRHFFSHLIYYSIFSVDRLLCFFLLLFQVRIVGSGIRWFLDASVDLCNWLKYVRSTNQSEAQNVRILLLAGEVRH